MSFEPRRCIPGLPPEAERALGEIQTAISRELSRQDRRGKSPRRRVTELVEEGHVIAKPGEVVRVQPGDDDIVVYLPEPGPENGGEDVVVSYEGDGTATGRVLVAAIGGTCTLPGVTTLNSPGQYRYTSIGPTSAKPTARGTSAAAAAGVPSAPIWSGPPPLVDADLPDDVVYQDTLPQAPVYDVMRAPFNAAGDGISDDTAAINAAIAAANVTSGAIYLGRRHLISGALTPLARDAIHIIGRGCRGDGTLITATGATPYNIFTIDTVKDCIIRDLFIEGPGTWASRGLGIFIDDAFRTRVERVEIQDTYGAIEIYASVITEIIDTYAAAILGPYAFYAYGSAADGENHALRFINCATGTDVTSGAITWYKQGSGSHTFELINCGALHGGKGLHVCDDTPYGSDSTPRFTRTLNFQCEDAEIHAIHLEAGATASFTHTLLLSCLGNAFQVDSTYGGNWEVNGGMIHGADGHGMSIQGDHWCVVGMQIGNIANNQNCVDVGSGSTDFRIEGCSLGDIYTRNAASEYGVNLDSTCDRFVIADCLIIGNDTGAINNPAGPATSRVIQGCNPTSVNTVRIDEIETMAAGRTVGTRVDAGGTGRPVSLTGAEQAENWRRATIQTVSGVSGTLDILLNDDTTVLLIRTTADATLRTLGDGLASAGREIVIEHDRLSGSGNLTIAHNTAGTYSTFFNPDTSSVVLGQTTCCTVRLRSGFWRPQGAAAARIRDADYGDVTVSSGGATWTVDNDVVTDAKLRNSAALSVIGRSANSTGDPADIAAGTDGHVLRRSGTTLGFGTVATAGITDAAVTNAKLANMAGARVKGIQVDGSTGAPQDLTPAELGELVRFNTVVSDTSGLSGNVSDFVIAEDTTVVRIDPSGTANFRSIVAPTTAGKVVFFVMSTGGGDTVTFEHENTGETAANRIRTPNGALFTMTQTRGAMLVYLSAGGQARWHVMSAPDAVTNAMLDTMAQATIKGRASGAGTGTPTDLSASQVVDIVESELEGRALAWTGGPQNFLAGIYNSGTLQLDGVISPSIAADTHNWNPTGFSTCNVIRVDNTSGGILSLTGITAGGNGRVIILINISGAVDEQIEIEDESASSTAANRIVHGSALLTLQPNDSIALWYDGTSSRWRPLNWV